jgi:hypothetical protein
MKHKQHGASDVCVLFAVSGLTVCGFLNDHRFLLLYVMYICTFDTHLLDHVMSFMANVNQVLTEFS